MCYYCILFGDAFESTRVTQCQYGARVSMCALESKLND